MHIGILQTGHVPDALADRHDDYDAMFARLLDGHGLTFDTYPVVDMVLPGSIHAAELDAFNDPPARRVSDFVSVSRANMVGFMPRLAW